jgi:hypothetical protein
MHRTLLLLLLNYFTDMFHICMIQWNNNKYEYEYDPRRLPDITAIAFCPGVL